LVQFGAEDGRWHAVEAPERTGEVRRLAVADLSRYLAHLDCGLGQQRGGGSHPSRPKIFTEGAFAELSEGAL
jgi:hypothetical protein